MSVAVSAALLGWLSLHGPDPVRAAADEAAVLVQEERYDEAMATLDAAERERADPVFVFMRGVVEDERGNCEAAIEHYDRFLALDVPEMDAQEARRRRDRCAQQLPPPPKHEDPVATPAPPPATTPVPPAAPPRDAPSPPPRKWYADPAGVTLSVVGIAALATGAGLYTQAQADARAARESTVLDRFDERATRAERLNRAGIALLSIGGAIVVAAIVRYAVVGARARKRRQRAAANKNYFGTLVGFR